MTDNTPDISLEDATELVNGEAETRWGQGYVERNQDTLMQAAAYIVNIGNNLPDTETEPGFYQ